MRKGLQLTRLSSRKYLTQILFFLSLFATLTSITIEILEIAFFISIPLPLGSTKLIAIGSFAFLTSLVIDGTPSTFVEKFLRAFFVSIVKGLPRSTASSGVFLLLVHTLVFLPLFLRGKTGPFFAGTDGETMQLDNLLSHQFSYPILGITNNPLQGLGGNQQWIYNYKIDPGYQLLFHLGNRGFAASLWFWILALSISILLIVRMIGFKNWLATPSALIIPYLLLSSHSYTFTLIFLIAPHNLYTIAITNIIIYLLIRQPKTQLHYLVHLFLIHLFFLYLVLLNPPYIVFLFPILLFTLVYHVKERKETALNLIPILISILVQFLLCGPFLAGLFLDSAAFVFRDQLQPVEFNLKHASVLFNFDRKLSIILYVLGIIATIYFALSNKSSSTSRSLAKITISALCFNLIYGLSWLSLDSLRKGLRPLYFEFFIWSFTLIFLFALLGKFIDGFIHRIGKSELRILPLLLGFVLCVNSSLMTFSEHNRRFIPPKDIPVIDNLLKQIELDKDYAFAGRLLVLFGNFSRQNELSKNLYEDIGTDFQRTMVWSKGIPTLNEFGHHISPASYLAIRTAFLDEDPIIRRNVLEYRLYNERLSSLFGIRFVISTQVLKSPDLELKAQLKTPRHHLFFYERTFIQSGILTPKFPIIVHDNNAAFSEIHKEAFNPANQFVVSHDALGSLEAYSVVFSSSFSIIPGGYRVSAKSNGVSILVLPIEFSNCFKSSSSKGELVRVNGAFLGVVFEKSIDVSLTYTNSPFTNPFCRIKNFLESKHFAEFNRT